VHFIRSVQWVAKKLSNQNKKHRELFVSIGQQILKAKTAAEVMTLFSIKKGECPLFKANLPKESSNETIVEWKQAAAWVEWWTRRRHLGKKLILCVLSC